MHFTTIYFSENLNLLRPPIFITTVSAVL